MSFLFHELLYRPLLNVLIFLYDFVISDLGIAIILATALVRLVLLPLFYKGAKDQTVIQQHVAPKIKEIQTKHKDNKEKQVQEMMAVYKEYNVSPFSGFLLLLVQLPVLFALYRVFLRDFGSDFGTELYSFVPIPDTIHTVFLGIVPLDERSIVLVVLAAAMQYLQSRLLFTIKKSSPNQPAKGGQIEMMEKMAKNMVYLGPILSVVILSQLPAAIAVYWMTTSVFSVLQQIVINKRLSYGHPSTDSS